MAHQAPQFKIEFNVKSTRFRIVKTDMDIHMSFLECDVQDPVLSVSHGYLLWQEFKKFYLTMIPFGCSDLYSEYLITDNQLGITLRDQSYLKLSVTNHPNEYHDLMIGLVSGYNQDYIHENVNIKLLMQIDDPKIKNLYKFDQNDQISSDSNQGINLMFPTSITIPGRAVGFTVDFGVICEPLYSTGYFLMPRSSIGKTPLRQANSIGLIDSTYRGHLMVKFDNVSDTEYQINAGESLFQLAQPSLVNHWSIQLVPFCGQTERGGGAFGSTGK